MNGYWNQIPLFRYLLPLIAGISVCLNISINRQWPMVAFICLVGIYAILFVISSPKWLFSLQPIQGFILSLAIFFGGFTLVISDTPIYKHNYFMVDTDSTTLFKCRVTKPPELTAKNIRVYANVDFVIQDSNISSATGKTILYLPIESGNNIKYGDYLLLQNKFSLPEPPKNPYAFDYGKYLNNQKIYHTAFLKAGNFSLTDKHKAVKVWQYIFAIKAYFSNLLEDKIHDKAALAVAQTLIIGEKSGLDAEVRQAYANTGTMHILAVSGLHVGILYLLLELLFKPLGWLNKKWKHLDKYKTVFILIIIWFYACLSGLSPSVSRSALMFTFLALGKLFDKQANTFNILFISMLILLIDNPFQLTQVGFQLSYLAVGGIVFFQPLIVKIWQPRFFLLRYFWSMTAVSLAAQLATSPISFYYFHQFPNYFILSNIIAIPLAFVVLMLGIILFATAAIPFVGDVVAYCLEMSLRGLNISILHIENLPYATTTGLYLTNLETACCYVVLIYFGAFLVLKNKRFLFQTQLACIAVASLITLRKLQNQQSNTFTFFYLKKESSLLVKTGSKAVLFADSANILETTTFNYQIEPGFVANGIKSPTIVTWSDTSLRQLSPELIYHSPLVLIGQKVVFILNSTTQHQLPTADLPVDYVLIQNNPFLNMEKVVKSFPKAVFVADGSNSRSRTRFWSKSFNENGANFYLLSDEGALEIDF